MKSNFTLLVLLLALPVPLQAGPRTSASYSIATDTADAGGTRTVSASYTNDGSAGGVAGMSTAAAPAETVRSGYVGQLYEVTALQVAASPVTVNEGQTRQLAASQLLDDSTTFAIAGTSVTWSIPNGPLTGIDANGLATAGIVYQNTGATAQGVFGGFIGTVSLTVLNVNLDDLGTYAADGIDDVWQVQYFGQDNPQAAPGEDPDADGSGNQIEYLAGTIPDDASSIFSPVAAASGGNMVISFLSVAGRHYTLESSDTLSAISWTTEGSVLTGAGGTLSFTIPTASPAVTRNFYRVLPGL